MERLGVTVRPARWLVACECSGMVRQAFRAVGVHAWSADLRPAADASPWHLHGDVRAWLAGGPEGPWDGMIAHPPCTRLTNAGVRWLHVPPPGVTLPEIWAELEDACAFYRTLREAPIPRKALENPIMHRHARERLGLPRGARQVVQPWMFGDPEFKAVGLELHNLPPLVPGPVLVDRPKPSTPEHARWSRVHRMPPSPERGQLRSQFFPGLARAMAAQWGALPIT